MKNKITDVRHWIACTIYSIFNTKPFFDKHECSNNIFYLFNIENFNGSKKIVIEKPNKKYYIKKEKWMSEPILFKIWEDLNNRDKTRKYFFSNNLYKTNDKNNIWISLGKIKESLDPSDEIKEIIEHYNGTKSLKTAQALIGGSRKYFNAYRVTLESIFSKSWLNKISNLFNGYNFSHNNLIGEEKHENGKICVQSLNPKLKNISNQQLFNLCDYLINSLNIIFKALENENLIK